MQKKTLHLVLGDLLAIALVTVIGFATHGEANLSFLPRMAAAFFPVSLAWFLLAPVYGLFRAEVVSDPKQLWRPVLAMTFAAPLAAVLRGLILNAPILPIFAVVLASTSALGMLVWRGIYWAVTRKR
ncbi:MAG: DUF3054 domain-containing protein [Chloroflexota bacterium]